MKFFGNAATMPTQTNADRIRAMSDEELAEELSAVASWDRKQYRKAKQIGIKKVMLDWLRQTDDGGKNATD